MLPHQRRRVARARLERAFYDLALRRIGKIIQRVTHAHRDVAQPSLITDAMDGAAGEPFVKLAFAPLEELNEAGAVEAISDGEIGFPGRLRKTVPGTYELAVVAAIDAVADQPP